MKKKYIPRIIVKIRDNIKVPYKNDDLQSFLLKNDVIPWTKLQKLHPGIKISRLFVSASPDDIDKMVKEARDRSFGRGEEYNPPNFNNFFAIKCPADIKQSKLVRDLRQLKAIESAYIEAKPKSPPQLTPDDEPKSVDQKYLNGSPEGIDAKFAWTVNGGDGSSVRFIDIEQGWNLRHEDLVVNGIEIVRLISGVNEDYREHGTKVLGVILAQDNGIGCIGITPAVQADVISEWKIEEEDLVYNTYDAILAAKRELNAGDILLIEADRDDLPVETDPTIFHIIKLTTNDDIIVIEPAGNASTDLDTFQDDAGRFVLNRNSNDFKDSKAILVGGATKRDDNRYSRSSSSNFGSRVDCFAWGSRIRTTSSDSDATRTDLYIASFGGTSGASAIIAGAAISIQSMVDQLRNSRFLPVKMRRVLSDPECGTPSRRTDTDRIGSMPDLSKIIPKYIQQGGS